MNPLNSITFHLKGLEKALGCIKSDATMVKAREKIMRAIDSMVPTVNPAVVPEPTVTLTATVSPPAQPEIVLLPVSDHGVEGDWGGASGTFSVETRHGVTELVEDRAPAPVEMIDGWPMRAEITIIGLSANRRMLRGNLAGRVVAIERKPGVNPGAVVQAKLVRAGSAPLFRMI